MASSYKALAEANELFNELTKRLPALASFSSQSYDTNGNPTITLASTSSPATTQKNVFIVIKPQTLLFNTSINTTPDAFVPLVLQFATEAPSGGAGHTSDFLSPSDLVALYGSLFARNIRIEMYQSANGTVPSISTIASGNFQTAFEPALYWGMLASQ